MKNIPNILSIARIIISITIPFVFNNKIICICLYVLVGITDILDGFIARKMNTTSQLGAKLDSLGDFVFSFSLILSLLIFRRDLINRFVLWIVIIFCIKACAFFINGIKNKNFASIHTIANKVTGLIIFISIIPIIMDYRVYFAEFFIVIVSLFSAVEELLIVSLFSNVDSNCKGLWQILHNKYHS